MRAHSVVVLAPGNDDGAGLVERGKPVLVQTLLAETTIEGLDERVVGGRA